MTTTETAGAPGSSQSPPPFNRFWVFLVLGILLRLVALNQPLLDAHLVRQAQTADWTRNGFEETAWPLNAQVSWRGDTGARLVLEFPLYNYASAGLWRVCGQLDPAGKLASILFWSLSFFVLQQIWKRWLTPRQTFWANILFLLSPLSVFFGQAFMPEMCIQLLAFCIVHPLLLYRETSKLTHYALFALAGLLGLLVKSLETSHLYLFALVIFWQKDGLKLLVRPEHWIGGAITLAAYLTWTGYVNQVNQSLFPDWTASALFGSFLGEWQARLNWHFYFKVAAYLAAFVAGPVGLLIAVFGLARYVTGNHNETPIRERIADRTGFPLTPSLSPSAGERDGVRGAMPSPQTAQIQTSPRRHRLPGFWWTGSLIFFYLVWGIKTAGLHSYYNLPALGPICYLFGLAMPAALDWINLRWRHSRRFATAARVTLVALVIVPLLACTAYLFRQDRTIYEAALWVKAHSQTSDLVVIRVNHRRDNNGYPEYPVFSYYAQRRTWVDTDQMKSAVRERAFATSQWAVITFPPRTTTWAEKIRDRIARYVPLAEIPNWPKPDAGFTPIHTTDGFAIYRKNP